MEKCKRSKETSLFLKQLRLTPVRSQKKFMKIIFIYYTINYDLFCEILDQFATILTMVSRERGKYFFYFYKEFLLRMVPYRPLRAKGAVFLCAALLALSASCSRPASTNLSLDSEILSLVSDTKKLPISIEEKPANDFIAKFYKNSQTKNSVLDFFASLTNDRAVAAAILDNAVKHEVPASLAFAIAYEESRFNPKALNINSGSKDRGLFQLNSNTFPELKESDAFNPEINAKEGIKYFKHVLDLSGNEISALAMYNAGRTRVTQKGAPVTTLDYISRILTYEKNIASLFTAKVVASSSLINRIKFGLLTTDREQAE